jgi:ubiquinone/menaquinone biosynthesis C-methylase UbiE
MAKEYEDKGAAGRYNASRSLPDETMALWMKTLGEIVPESTVKLIVDLGGGTGRFAEPLHETFQCPTILIEPSEAMLKQSTRIRNESIWRVRGTAEQIPLETNSVDMVWMCQVYHHLENKTQAFREIHRILKPNGYLAIRNGTKESEVRVDWLNFFPEALKRNNQRIPAEADIIETAGLHSFNLIKVETVNQIFATSYMEYYEKISQRGLSSLIAISDKAFETGRKKLLQWAKEKPADQPVYDPVDLFVFGKSGTH